MNDFFDSEMVRKSMEDIKELQEIVTNSIIQSALSPVYEYE